MEHKHSKYSIYTLQFLLLIWLSAPAGFASCPSISASQVHASRYTLNVRDFGAKGDGVTDDRPAIQDALQCAQQLRNSSLIFNSGVYRLASFTSMEAQLDLGSWTTPFSIQIIGKNTVLRTDQAGTILLRIQGYLTDGLIQGIDFQNNHPLTALSTVGVGLTGGGQNAITRMTIKQCRFQNFSRGLTVVGVSGMLIQNNEFLMNSGRDSGTSSNLIQPNVGIWLFNSFPNGTAVDIEVANNLYDGCSSGTLANAVARVCGDGLVFGRVSHGYIHDNVIRRFSFEGIFIARNIQFGIGSPKPTVIEKNSIDATQVPGDVYGGGQWGIRCDDDGTIINNNTISNALAGILVYGADYSSNIANVSVTNNAVNMSNGNSPLNFGIGVFLASNTTVDSNTIIFPAGMTKTGAEVYGIILTGGDNGVRLLSTPVVCRNTLIGTSNSANTRLTGIFWQWVGAPTVSTNLIKGFSQAFHFLNYGTSVSQLSSIIHANTLTGNSQLYLSN